MCLSVSVRPVRSNVSPVGAACKADWARDTLHIFDLGGFETGPLSSFFDHYIQSSVRGQARSLLHGARVGGACGRGRWSEANKLHPLLTPLLCGVAPFATCPFVCPYAQHKLEQITTTKLHTGSPKKGVVFDLDPLTCHTIPRPGKIERSVEPRGTAVATAVLLKNVMRRTHDDGCCCCPLRLRCGPSCG